MTVVNRKYHGCSKSKQLILLPYMCSVLVHYLYAYSLFDDVLEGVWVSLLLYKKPHLWFLSLIDYFSYMFLKKTIGILKIFGYTLITMLFL